MIRTVIHTRTRTHKHTHTFLLVDFDLAKPLIEGREDGVEVVLDLLCSHTRFPQVLLEAHVKPLDHMQAQGFIPSDEVHRAWVVFRGYHEVVIERFQTDESLAATRERP